MNQIEEKLRNLTIPQLEILKAIAESSEGILDSQEIMNTTETSTAQFGAYVAALKKFKSDNGDPIIIPAGKTSEGTRWQLNEKVIGRIELLSIVNNMKI